MSKRTLEAEVWQTRGGHACNKVLTRIQEMDEEEARQWLLLFTYAEQDAERDGERRGARAPWRHM